MHACTYACLSCHTHMHRCMYRIVQVQVLGYECFSVCERLHTFASCLVHRLVALIYRVYSSAREDTLALTLLADGKGRLSCCSSDTTGIKPKVRRS